MRELHCLKNIFYWLVKKVRAVKTSRETHPAREGLGQGTKAEQWQRLPGWTTLPRGGEKGVKQKPSEPRSNDSTSEAKQPDRNFSQEDHMQNMKEGKRPQKGTGRV